MHFAAGGPDPAPNGSRMTSFLIVALTLILAAVALGRLANRALAANS